MQRSIRMKLLIGINRKDLKGNKIEREKKEDDDDEEEETNAIHEGKGREEEEKKEGLQKCLDKHTIKPSIIYLVLFIEFPVYVS